MNGRWGIPLLDGSDNTDGEQEEKKLSWRTAVLSKTRNSGVDNRKPREKSRQLVDRRRTPLRGGGSLRESIVMMKE